MNYSDKIVFMVNKQNYLLEPQLDITAYESVMISKLIAIVTIHTSQSYNYDTKRFIEENKLERHFTIQENI
jgi:hypothetical protein